MVNLTLRDTTAGTETRSRFDTRADAVYALVKFAGGSGHRIGTVYSLETPVGDSGTLTLVRGGDEDTPPPLEYHWSIREC